MAPVHADHPRTPDPAKHLTLALVFRTHGRDFLTNQRLSGEQQEIMKAILTCRTSFLGGRKEQCDHCGQTRLVFCSCRNRHCPTCQATVKARWLQKRRAELLPVPYFHLVFTVPHELNPLALYNRRVIGEVLFHAVSRTVLEFGANTKKRLGGKVGFLTILHTWDQQLRTHFHLHCLMPAGALSPDCSRWIPCAPTYLFPVKALATVFRAKFIERLKLSSTAGLVTLPPPQQNKPRPNSFEQLIDTLWQKKWVVYAKPALEQPDKVLDYLGRYVHRVALANHRIYALDHDSVTLTYHDRKNKLLKKVKLSGQEFIRRFMLHTLPKRFMRIRAYGFLANRAKKTDLNRCRELLAEQPQRAPAHKSIVHLLTECQGAYKNVPKMGVESVPPARPLL